jgi:hypothetical protein
MSDEQLLTDVLSALAMIGRAVNRKVLDLRGVAAVSGVTSAVEVGKTLEEDYPKEIPPGMYPDVVVSAYVDGSLEGAHGVAWTLDLIRRGSGWEIDRGITLHANDERDDVVEELRMLTCRDSRELASVLPALVEEWLEMPIPPIPEASARK